MKHWVHMFFRTRSIPHNGVHSWYRKSNFMCNCRQTSFTFIFTSQSYFRLSINGSIFKRHFTFPSRARVPTAMVLHIKILLTSESREISHTARDTKALGICSTSSANCVDLYITYFECFVLALFINNYFFLRVHCFKDIIRETVHVYRGKAPHVWRFKVWKR
jgi:hypothetical protein